MEISDKTVSEILRLYGIDGDICERKIYIDRAYEDFVKQIFSVKLKDGKHIVVKILREEDDYSVNRRKFEKQSEFSEFMRKNGIKTPKRYLCGDGYCSEYECGGVMCHVTVEDWCGEEVGLIDSDLSYKIGQLMACMHTVSLENNCEIGFGTLFSAAYENDVDAFPEFCKICENDNIDSGIVEQIKKIREEKLAFLRSVWTELPKAAVQGDISINNLVFDGKDITVFDYNNAGDEVLISDLVMEGLLTAYEMDIPEDADPACREEFFPAFLNGYLSVRKLSEKEAETAWVAYTLYHGLWFTRIMYNKDSLEKLVERGDFSSANTLLRKMLDDMTEENDGRFRSTV
ncbi:MAG: hypothetical protein J6D42_01395 [Clostridia bacterium]|nr:hypothetical protein [Clostridia bacterium]